MRTSWRPSRVQAVALIAVLGVLALAIAREGPRALGVGLCAASLSSDVPAGLAWANEEDICISTGAGGSRSLMRRDSGSTPQSVRLHWSPDGATLAVDDEKGTEFVSASGQRVSSAVYPEWYARLGVGRCATCDVISPDGRLVARAVISQEGSMSLRMGPVGATELQSVAYGGAGASWSADSRWLAYWLNHREGFGYIGKLFVIRADGTDRMLVAEHAGSPAWRPPVVETPSG